MIPTQPTLFGIGGSAPYDPQAATGRPYGGVTHGNPNATQQSGCIWERRSKGAQRRIPTLGCPE